jgi:ABC-type microcin C transport system permease subunit YejE
MLQHIKKLKQNKLKYFSLFIYLLILLILQAEF